MARPVAGILALALLGACKAPPSTPPPPPPAGEPPPRCENPAELLPGAAPVRLLTRSEYDNTIRDLLHDDSQPARAFPPENSALGFDNNAEAHLVSPLLVEKYQIAAEEIAARAVATRLPLLLGGCNEDDGACAHRWITRFGRRAFRRPLTAEETQIFRDLYATIKSTDTFERAIELTLTAFLQSPQFLYRIEELRPGEGPVVPLDAYQLASRLSYFLWNTTPDDVLLDAAGTGQLDIEAQARRMLADPRAKHAAHDFHRQWLELDKIDGLVKDLENFGARAATPPPGLAALRASWKNSLHDFLDHALFEAADPLAALFESRTYSLDATTGPLYGRPELTAATRVELPKTERAGLLTHPALLARLAHPDQTSPIHRGIFIREKLLCQNLPPPPNDIQITAPSPDPTATTRQRFAQHTADPACSGCHNLIDPLGFGLENYDELGRFRTTENSLPIDARGELIGAGRLDGPFTGAIELSQKLRSTSTLEQCVATQWYRYAMGRGEAAPADACALEKAAEQARGNLRELLVAITLTDAFRYRPGTPLTEPSPLPPDPDAGIFQPPPLSQPDGGISESSPPADPIGVLEEITALGIARGWALDPNTPDYPLLIEFFVDGGPGHGPFQGSQRASRPRPDVNQNTGYSGDHGFEHMLPLGVLDGRPHQLFAVAYNTGSGANTILGPISFTLGDVNRVPQGFVETVDENGVVSGWALDPDSAPATIAVHFYVDGPTGTGIFAGSTQTGISRPDVSQALGVAGDHGYQFTLPPQFRDGRTHTLFAYGIDSAGGINPVLRNSPYSFTSN